MRRQSPPSGHARLVFTCIAHKQCIAHPFHASSPTQRHGSSRCRRCHRHRPGHHQLVRCRHGGQGRYHATCMPDTCAHVHPIRLPRSSKTPRAGAPPLRSSPLPTRASGSSACLPSARWVLYTAAHQHVYADCTGGHQLGQHRVRHQASHRPPLRRPPHQKRGRGVLNNGARLLFYTCVSQMVPYKIVPGNNGDAWVEVRL